MLVNRALRTEKSLMQRQSQFLTAAVVLAAFLPCEKTHAQAPLVTIETVLVGDPGNAADTNNTETIYGGASVSLGRGSVAYTYAIGKFEVTIWQYVAFLNAVAKNDPYGLWDPRMESDLNIAGVARTGSPGSYSYSAIGPSGAVQIPQASASNRPIAYINWFDAARFANWLHNGATNGASTETGAYTLNGATNGAPPARNVGARWWIPTEDEWYKAAYYKAGNANAGYWLYPTQSNITPGGTIGSGANQANYLSFVGFTVTGEQSYGPSQNYLTDVGAFSGSPSAYGTYDQGGNLWEWSDLSGSAVALRGGYFGFLEFDLQSTFRLDVPAADYADESTGFRLATLASTPTPPSPPAPTPAPTTAPTSNPVATAPTLTAPASASSRRTNYVLQLTATDDTGIAQIQYRIKGPGSKKFSKWTTRGLKPGANSGWSVKLRLPARGKWQIEVQAFDTQGNPSAVRSLTVRRR